MVNKITRDALLTVVAEWLEENQLPPMVQRNHRGIDLTSLRRILAIVGPRRAGKTYFMYQLIKSLIENGQCTKKDVLFVDFEDFRLSAMKAEDIDELLSAFNQLTGQYPRFLFFDEVQNIPTWSRVVRTLHNRGRFKIVVSGSNSRLLGREVATELRGRYDDLLMLPFSFREYVRYQGISFTPATFHTPAKGKILAAFDRYVSHGGFPEVVMAQSDAERRSLLRNYFRSIFYRDILERYNIKARYVLDALMTDFLDTYASLFSITKFEKALRSGGLHGSKRTIANHLQYLQDAFFVIVNEKFAFSPRKRAMNPKKIYLSDTGFASLGWSFTENRGRLLENVVAIELFRRNFETYYHRNKRECDFIVRDETGIKCAIQVCWELTEHNRKRELLGLVDACRAFDLTSAVVMTHDQEGRITEDGMEISVLPVWKWLLMDPATETP